MDSQEKPSTSVAVLDQLVNGLGEAVLQSIRDPFGIITRDFRILWANRAMTAVHWHDQGDVTGRICYEARAGRRSPCPGCPVEPVLQTGRTQIIEKSAEFPDGETRWGEVRSYPIRGDDSSVVAVFVFVIETTEKRRDLEQQKQYAALLSQRLSELTDGEKEVTLDDGEIRLRVNLSNRESEILRLVTEGYTNIQICEILDISINTVKTHVNHIFNKLGVNDRTQAAVLATRHQLV